MDKDNTQPRRRGYGLGRLRRLVKMQVILKEWIKGGRKGTKQRKIRGRLKYKERQKAEVVTKARAKRKATRKLQQSRRNKGRNRRTG